MSDSWVEMRYSKDGGHSFSNWEKRTLGEVGEYQDRIRPRWWQLGTSRQWVFHFRVSSPRNRDCFGAVCNLEILDA